jgi:hypothetical protein
MTHFKWLLIALAAGVFFVPNSASVFEVQKNGKRIQRDGFLLEWPVSEAVVLDGPGNVRMNAVNTPEGLAGFVSYITDTIKTSQKLAFYPRAGVWTHPIEVTIGNDSTEPAGPFSVERVRTDTSEYVNIEWILAWDWIKPDSTGIYSVGLSVLPDSGADAATCVIKGKYIVPSSSQAKPAGLRNQVILVVCLLGIYIYLRARAKKYMKKKPAN